MLIKFLVSVVFIRCLISYVNCSSADVKRVYHDISSGQGLYKPNDKVVIINSNDFSEQVHNSESAWLVEFYNSWCGHCIQFAPIWKSFGADVLAWKRVVQIGAVDCSSEVNADLCREYEIMRYPTIRYFPPRTKKGNYGVDFDKKYNVDGLRTSLVKKIIDQSKNESLRLETWPSFSNYDRKNVFDVWSLISQTAHAAIFFVEKTTVGDLDDGPIDGIEFILDMSYIPDVFVTRVSEHSAAAKALQLTVIPGVAILKKDNDIIPFIETSRDDRIKAVRNYLELNGVAVPKLLSPGDKNKNSTPNAADVIRVIQEEMNRPDQDVIVYQIDLESALKYSLEKDIPLKALPLESSRLDALKKYIQVLKNYFPFGVKGIEFLLKLNSSIFERESLSPIEFQNLVVSLRNTYDPYLMKAKTESWIGCTSKFSGLRRYPCGLWTLFHTLTVAAESKSKSSIENPKEVLHAMQGYIKHFFSCSECADNFVKETVSLNKDVNSLDDSILYLWKVHNSVNRRLHQYPGNLTEDPDHPKIQFPSKHHCPTCYTPSDEWNTTEVLKYLKNIYSKISYKAVSDFETVVSDSLESHPQTKRSVMEPLIIDTRYFNIFDISLCVILYFASAGILILVGLKFFLKKSTKRRYSTFEILRKA